MNKLSFIFDEEKFSTIFPFYLLLDNNLIITSLGKSIAKIFPSIVPGRPFKEAFSIKRPFLEFINAETLNQNVSQLIILEATDDNSIYIRGQFEIIDDGILFVGSPWFTSMNDVRKKSLNINDFAPYDPLLDLLQTLNTQELTTLQLKELLEVNNRQKDQLAIDKDELNKLSLVASANENAIVFTHPNAEIFWYNDAYARITGYSREEIIGKTPIEVGRTAATDKEALSGMVERFYKGESFDVEVTHGRKDGTYFWTRIKGQPIFDTEGKVVQYFAMIEDKTLEKEQEEQLVLLSLIAQKNINAVVICDKEGYIEWVNPSFTQITGYEFHELVGKKPGVLQGPDSNPETVQYLHEQIEKGEPFNCEIINYNKEGKKYWIKIQGQALYNKWGEITRFFALQEDVTAKKMLEAQKEELLDSLEKSNKELEDYAQIVSHDLKSPLRSINSLIAWIKEDNAGTITPQTSTYFTMIEDKLEKMDHLIQGILTYSKIDKTDIRKEQVDVYEIVKNISSIIEIPENVTVTITNRLPVIEADRFRIHQLFQNLIGNAVSYIDKPQGFVEIGSEEQKDCHLFYVKDNGPGIAKESHEKIFKIFQSLVKNDKSTGIGLSIVKKIVDNYNGKIWVESELTQGTTFYIQLPK